MPSRILAALLFAAGLLLLAGCDYESPLASAPTQKIDPRLPGDWLPAPKDGEKGDPLHVRRYDDTTYIATVDGDAYRVFHTEVAGLPFVSVQDLNSDARKYCAYTWRLSADGRELVLRRLNNRIVPDTLTDTAALQRAITDNLQNPKLLEEELHFTRKPAPGT